MYLSNGRTLSVPPQAFAETSPMFQQSYFVPATGIALEKRFATYASLYRQQPNVYAAVRKIATLAARLGVSVWDIPTDTKANSGHLEAGKALNIASPYARLMANPCPTLDQYSFWLWVFSTIEIYGEAFLLKVRDEPVGNSSKGKVSALLPMHPIQTQIERDDEGGLWYRFMGQPNELIPESDVVPLLQYNPDNTMRGLSMLEPLRETLMNDDGARRAQQAWWRNMGRPSMYLHTEKRLGRLGRERLQTAMKSLHGGADNAGGTLVLEDALKAESLQLNSEELQYIESRKLNREEVCTAVDLPPTALQIMDNATYTNIVEQLRSIYRDCMTWRLVAVEAAIDFHVGGEFNGYQKLKFNTAEVMRGDLEVRAQAAAMLVDHGIGKPAEVRPWFDFGDAGEVADQLYANAAIQPLGKPAVQERIAIAGQVGGPTLPDQLPTIVPPAGAAGGAAPSLPGGITPPKPVPGRIGVPALPAGRSSTSVSSSTSSTPRSGSKPALSKAAQRYVRNIGGQIGRGDKSLRLVVKALIDENPDDMEFIAEAAAHLLEVDRRKAS